MFSRNLHRKIAGLEAERQALGEEVARLRERPTALSAGTIFDIGNLRSTSRRQQNVAEIRQRAQSVPVAHGRVLCRSLGRYKLYVDAADVGFGAHLMLDGFWEFGVTEFITRNVAQGMTALDLGANVGYYTLLMADLVGPDGRVIAFEPNPASANSLADSVSINGYNARVTVRHEAIWHRSGDTLHFRVPAAEPKNASVVSEERAKAVRSDESIQRVSTFALDDLPQSVAFVKVDIEGAEEKLWQGSRKFFARNPAMTFLLEFNCARCTDAAGTLREMSAQFPLRVLDNASRVRAAEPDEMLKTSHDWMLVLSRKPSEAL